MAMLLSSCELAPIKPTRVRVTDEIPVKYRVRPLDEPVVMADETKVVDVRSRFLFEAYHVKGAVYLSEGDFFRRKQPGQLTTDTDGLIRRLQLKGLHPKNPVIVVGAQLDMQLAARVALVFVRLGFNDVQVAAIEAFQRYARGAEEATENAPLWTAEPVSFAASKSDLLKVLKGEEKGRVLDVRSEKQYLSRSDFGGPYSTPNVDSINIPFEQFFSKVDGRPSKQLKAELSGLGLGVWDKVVLIDDRGMDSQAALMALLGMGYRRVSYIPGGWSSFSKQQ